jgi:Protein of unknown function (DUF3667)
MHTPPPDPPLELAPLAPADAPFEPEPESSAAAAAPIRAECANCGVQLLGPHCYACGQPVKGMVRHLSSILADASDTILNIDSRIFRTLWPLLARPGFLTCEYFAGRRVRYVTPFRLYFFLSVAAFFLLQFALGDLNMSGVNIDDRAQDAITKALTSDEVTRQRDAAIASMRQAESAPMMPAAGSKGIEAGIAKIEKKAAARLEYLQKVEAAKAKAEPAPPDPDQDDLNFNFGGKAWDPKSHPIQVQWLPQFCNDKLNQMAGHAKDNLGKISKDPKPFLIGAVSMLPQVLFVLMPLFAFMLKIFYIFKRRLYMEHLIVALHSHAFIFLALFLLTLAGMAGTWAAAEATWLVAPLHWIVIVLGWWLPIYLFLMQKKVYKQGWIMTSIKFGVIGISYSVLISFGVTAAVLLSLATT